MVDGLLAWQARPAALVITLWLLYIGHHNSIEKFTSILMHYTIIVLRSDRPKRLFLCCPLAERKSSKLKINTVTLSSTLDNLCFECFFSSLAKSLIRMFIRIKRPWLHQEAKYTDSSDGILKSVLQSTKPTKREKRKFFSLKID